MFVEFVAHTHTHTHMELLLNGLSSNSAIHFRSSSNKSFLRQSHTSQSPTELWFHAPCSSSSSSLVCLSGFRTRKSGCRRGGAGKGRGGRVAAVGAAVVAMVDAAEEVPEETTRSQAALLLRPTPAEAARTVMEVCVEGTLSTLSEDGWPLGTEIRFAVDVDGNPVFSLQSSALHTRNLLSDSRCSLHAQLEQPGRQKPQCTLWGRIARVDGSKHKEIELAWERRFGTEHLHDGAALYVMNVERALQAPDMGEEETWVTGSDYRDAVADPLRDCAPKIVEDMNHKHWQDIRRFCNIYTHLDVELEEASMTWVDRLGFDLRVLTREPQNILEIRIPFPREVTDERDARSTLTIMAQIAWERERNYSPADALFSSM
ncbi:hypothetical protein BDL97_16G085000 [Sphagnum fallax]|nr:hypothetical protein BDL97_16G085000 [Sphagnum fallax]KAH8938474.1 hypothetical protein BDL97_16G085000 [Sphagnum fallax]